MDDVYIPKVYQHKTLQSYFKDFYFVNKSRNPRRSYLYWSRTLKWPLSLLNEVIHAKKDMPIQKLIQFGQHFLLDLMEIEYLVCLRFSIHGKAHFDLLSQRFLKAFFDFDDHNNEAVQNPPSHLETVKKHYVPSNELLCLREKISLTEEQYAELRQHLNSMENLVYYLASQSKSQKSRASVAFSLSFVGVQESLGISA